jgi:hypothetical protein
MQLGGSRKWKNVDTQESIGIYQDHISVHLGGSSNSSTSLGYWRPYNIANRKVHMEKVQYLPHVKTQYFELMTANKNQIDVETQLFLDRWPTNTICPWFPMLHQATGGINYSWGKCGSLEAVVAAKARQRWK